MSTQAAKTILQSVMKALGGARRLQKLESAHLAGRVLLDVPGRFHICGKWESWFTKQGQYREELDLPGENTRIRIFDFLSGGAWISSADGVREKMRAVKSMRNVKPDVFRNAYLALLAWLFPKERIPATFGVSRSKDHHHVDIMFKGVDGIRISIKDSDKLPDQVTWLNQPARLRGCRHSAGLRLCGSLGGFPDIVAAEEASQVDAVAKLSDWKTHELGFKYPRRIGLRAASSQEQTFIVERLDVNVPTDGLFRMPRIARRVRFKGKARKTQSVKIPFRLFDSKIVVEVLVNNHGPLSFIFDTGCATTIIDETLFRKLGLGSPCQFAKESGSAEVKELIVADGVSIEVGELTMDTQNILVAQINQIAETRLGLSIAGLLGGSFIRNFVTVIDYRLQTITLSDPSTHNWNNSNTIPIRIESGVPFVDTEGKVGDTLLKGSMMVDTGSEWNIVFTKPFSDDKQLTKKVEPSFETMVVSVAGDTEVQAGRLDELSIGGLRIKKPMVALPKVAEGSFASSTMAGFLGADSLSRYRVVFDYQGSRMSLVAPGRRRFRSDHDMSGLVLKQNSKARALEVVFVIRDSPAAELGLQKGDLIESINGVSTSDWSMAEWAHINRNGEKYVLSVRRADELLNVTILMNPLM